MFPDVKMKNYDYIDNVRLSSPTCEQLGIPNDDQGGYPVAVRNTSLHIDGIRYEAVSKTKSDPFSPYSMIPLPAPFGGVFDSSCIRRRNERERDRVRCVNDGYLRLKEHLPLDNKDKRISKVETLRGAIQYIKHLQSILDSHRGDALPDQDSNIEKYRGAVKSGRSVGDKHQSINQSSEVLFDCDSVSANAENECPPTELNFQETKSVPGTSAKLKRLRAASTMRPN